MTIEPLVRARDVARSFGSGRLAVVAVHGVSCEIHPGDRIALTGPSGSGKTSLLHLLAGLDEPTKGIVEWPAIGPRAVLRPGPVAIVFQGPSLLPPLDVVDNVALPLLLQGAERGAARTSAVEALAAVDIEDLASKLPEELSGGQAQRVAVARAVVGQPRLILADEPTGQLDHDNAARVLAALLAASNRVDAALIVNTHDPAIAEHLDVHWSMTDGRLRCDVPAAR